MNRRIIWVSLIIVLILIIKCNNHTGSNTSTDILLESQTGERNSFPNISKTPINLFTGQVLLPTTPNLLLMKC